MSNVERRLADWRRTMAETANCRAEVIDELEGHLRDEMQRLVLAGETEERALELALVRLGAPEALGAEFARATPTTWLPVRLAKVLLLVLAALLVGYGGSQLQNGRWGPLLTSHVIAVTLGYTATLVVGGLAVCYVLARLRRGLTTGQERALAAAVFGLTRMALAFTAVGVLLGGFWAKDHLGRFWGWDPKEIGAAFVLAWNLAMLAFSWLRPAATRLAMLLAFAGNIVVSTAWFGPLAFGFTSPIASTALMVFAFTQLGLLGLGLAPVGFLRRRTT